MSDNAAAVSPSLAAAPSCNIGNIGDSPEALQARLAALEQKLSLQGQLLESIDQALIATDIQGQIMYWNRFAERLYGWSAAEVMGRSILDVTPATISQVQAAEIMTALLRGERWAGEFWVQRRDGHSFPAEVTDSPILDAQGQLIGVVGISHDISERMSLAQELELRVAERTAQWQSTSEELRLLAAHLQRVREEERARIARELHDELGQVLSVVRMDLGTLARNLERDPRSITYPRSSVLQSVQAMQGMLEDTLKSIRGLITQLRPEFIDEVGLPAALAWQLEQFQAHSGIICQLTADVADPALDRGLALQLFRIVQESLTNVARHAQATRVDVSLSRAGNRLALDVRDNGRGVSPTELQKSNHFGVMGMRERVLAFGGEFTISGAPGQGTSVSVRAPLSA